MDLMLYYLWKIMKEKIPMKLQIHPKDSMTPKERGEAIAKGLDYDRLIMDPFLGEIKARMIGKNTREYWNSEDNLVEAEVFSFNRFGLDGMGVGPNAYGIAEAMGIKAHYPEQGMVYVEEYALTDIHGVESLKDVDINSGKLQMYYNASARLREMAEGICGVGVAVSGPMTLASFLLGLDKFLKALVRNPEEVHKLLRYVTRNVKRVVDIFAVLDVGFSLADPIASTTMISPKMYAEFALPYTQEITSYIRQKSGGRPSYHVCGNTKKIWDRVKDLDIALFSIDNEMDIVEACRFFADCKAMAGNVDPVHIIAKGTKEQIEQEVKKCIEAGRQCRKGFVLTPGCNLPLTTEEEKIDAFLDAGRKYSCLLKEK